MNVSEVKLRVRAWEELTLRCSAGVTRVVGSRPLSGRIEARVPWKGRGERVKLPYEISLK